MAESLGAFLCKGREFDAATGVARFLYRSEGTETFDFIETITFPKPEAGYDEKALSLALDTLAIILGTSYWKLFCPKEIRVEFAPLSEEQAKFFDTLYTKGMGEFFYQNKIDFRGLVKFPFEAGKKIPADFSAEKSAGAKRALVLVGGGKDSAVSFELAKKSGLELTQFVVNSDRIKDAVMDIAGAPRLIVKRELDPQIFELAKRSETFKGHVPATAIVQGIALVAAILGGYDFVVASNEESASYGNVAYLGEEINHQWSKSLEYENLWREYVARFITPHTYPFSLLRPLSELKIIELFSHHSKYFSAFSSCNKNFTIHDKQKVNWCCECPKCAFVFAGLAAFLPKSKVIGVFGKDLFANENLIPLYRELLGLENMKPFECVGTADEVRLMLYLTAQKGEYAGEPVISMFECDCKDIYPQIKQSQEKLLSVGKLENLPEEFKTCYENQ